MSAGPGIRLRGHAARTVPQPIATRLGALQQRLGEAVFARVAGPEGPAKRARFNAPGPRWFEPDRPIRRVHGDAAMFVGGLRALLLQSLHPQAMIAVAQHSDYRSDPWGRLQRTSAFLAATSYGNAAEAQRAVDRVRHVHQHISGTGPDGQPYRADDPHLLGWVHVAETDSFLRCHQRYGTQPLDAAGCDGYVADSARIALALGVPDPPRTVRELAAALRAYRPELRGTPEALEAARFLVWSPPLPLLARGPYALLAATAIAELPAWARQELKLPRPGVAESLIMAPVGRGMVGAIRWAMGARALSDGTAGREPWYNQGAGFHLAGIRLPLRPAPGDQVRYIRFRPHIKQAPERVAFMIMGHRDRIRYQMTQDHGRRAFGIP